MNTNEKIKNWFKTNWISIILVICFTGVIFLFFKQFTMDSSYEKLLSQKYAEQSESFKKQINEIQKINDDRFKLQEELLKSYDLKIKQIDEEYKKSLADVLAKQKRNQMKIVEEAKQDPTTLTGKIRETFNIPVKE
jgi:hypothetical protein